MDNLRLLNADGSVPTTGALATQSGQFAFVTVNPTTHRLQVDAAIITDSPSSEIATTKNAGTKAVTTAGSAERLTASTTKVGTVLIMPLRSNTGRVYVGTASGSLAQHFTLPLIISAPSGKYLDLTDYYIDVTVNGEGVAYLALS